MNKKYAIHPDFCRFSQAAPMNKGVLWLSEGMLSLAPKGIKSDETVSVQKMKIPASDGKNILVTYIRRKAEDKERVALLYCHGGAFAYKAAPFQYRLAKRYAAEGGCDVLFVDYRLSFHHPFETPLKDCFDVYRYVCEKAKTFGIRRLAVGGDSAGGYLAARVSVLAHENKLPAPVCQLLIYPVLDSEMTTPSMREFTDTPVWNAARNREMWRYYEQGDKAPSLLRADAALFPPTYVEVAQFDCLRDEGIFFYEKLKERGADATLNCTEGTVHGFDGNGKSRVTEEAIQKRIGFLREKCR